MPNPYAPRKIVGPKSTKKADLAAAPATVEVAEVPAGTISEVKSWVGSDLERAQKALDAENEKEDPRVTLVAYLEALINGEDE